MPLFGAGFLGGGEKVEGVPVVFASSKEVEMSRSLLPLKPSKGHPQLVQFSTTVIHVGHNKMKNIFLFVQLAARLVVRLHQGGLVTDHLQDLGNLP